MVEYVATRRKNNTIKTNETIRGNKPEGVGERKKTKKISRQNKTIQTKLYIPNHRVGWLVGWVLWHINRCRLFNAKSIFIQINSSMSNNSV